MTGRAIIPSLFWLLLSSGSALALGPGGLSSNEVLRISVAPGHQRLQLGLHFVPLIGYESNYQVTTRNPTGSGVWALEGGGELHYRTGSLRLHLELAGMLRMPFKDVGLAEFHGQLPLQLLYRIGDRLDLALASQLVVERGKTPPIFIDPGEIDPALMGGANRTIRYTSVQEELQPGMLLDLSEWARLELHPYFRFKQVSFLDRAWEGEPDYRLLDAGGVLAWVLRWRDHLSVRLRYDIARRFFLGYPARPPTRQPALGQNLAMTRHIGSLRLRGRIYGPLQGQAGYSLRFSDDNGGFHAALDHLVWAGLSMELLDRLQLSAGLSYLRRSYRERTPCQAEEEPPGSGIYLGSSCLGLSDPSPLPQWEDALIIDLRAAVSILPWFQVVVSYDLENSRSELEGVVNHRVLGGIGFSY